MKLKSSKTDLMSVCDISCSPGSTSCRGERVCTGRSSTNKAYSFSTMRLAVDGFSGALGLVLVLVFSVSHT
jgi:hypothetical protein